MIEEIWQLGYEELQIILFSAGLSNDKIDWSSDAELVRFYMLTTECTALLLAHVQISIMYTQLFYYQVVGEWVKYCIQLSNMQLRKYCYYFCTWNIF